MLHVTLYCTLYIRNETLPLSLLARSAASPLIHARPLDTPKTTSSPSHSARHSSRTRHQQGAIPHIALYPPRHHQIIRHEINSGTTSQAAGIGAIFISSLHVYLISHDATSFNPYDLLRPDPSVSSLCQSHLPSNISRGGNHSDRVDLEETETLGSNRGIPRSR